MKSALAAFVYQNTSQILSEATGTSWKILTGVRIQAVLPVYWQLWSGGLTPRRSPKREDAPFPAPVW